MIKYREYFYILCPEIISRPPVKCPATPLGVPTPTLGSTGLEIQHVRPQDAGLFHCQQFDQSKHFMYTNPAVDLSVVSCEYLVWNQDSNTQPLVPKLQPLFSVTRWNDGENIELRCKVFTSHLSFLPDVKMQWPLNTKDVNHPEINSINLAIPPSHYLHDRVNQLECEVSRGPERKSFSLKPDKSGETRRKRLTEI